ncbi:MAG TPA: hypothetical protein VGG74_11795 [Kofleriaceae bacterium]
MTRRSMGCGFLPPLEARLPSWRPRAFPDESGAGDVCAGYLVRLPEVIEAARAYTHWSNGELAAFCGSLPPELLVISIEIIAGSIAELNVATMKPASQGGLGSG